MRSRGRHAQLRVPEETFYVRNVEGAAQRRTASGRSTVSSVICMALCGAGVARKVCDARGDETFFRFKYWLFDSNKKKIDDRFPRFVVGVYVCRRRATSRLLQLIRHYHYYGAHSQGRVNRLRFRTYSYARSFQIAETHM